MPIYEKKIKELISYILDKDIKEYIEYKLLGPDNYVYSVDLSSFRLVSGMPTSVNYDHNKRELLIRGEKITTLFTREAGCPEYASWFPTYPQKLIKLPSGQYLLNANYYTIIKLDSNMDYAGTWSGAPAYTTDMVLHETDSGAKYVLVGSWNPHTIYVIEIDDFGNPIGSPTPINTPNYGLTPISPSNINEPTALYKVNNKLFVANYRSSDNKGYISLWDISDPLSASPIDVLIEGLTSNSLGERYVGGVYYDELNSELYVSWGRQLIVYHYDIATNEIYLKNVLAPHNIYVGDLRQVTTVGNYILVIDRSNSTVLIYDKITKDYIGAYPTSSMFKVCSNANLGLNPAYISVIEEDGEPIFYVTARNQIKVSRLSRILQELVIEFDINFERPLAITNVVFDIDKAEFFDIEFIPDDNEDAVLTCEGLKNNRPIAQKLTIRMKINVINKDRILTIFDSIKIKGIYVITDFVPGVSNN